MNDPITSLITWTTYGTWLPGDMRGWRKREGGDPNGLEIHDPGKLIAFDLSGSKFNGDVLEIRFQLQKIELDMCDYEGKYFTNLAPKPAFEADWPDHKSANAYVAIRGIGFSVSNGSAIGYESVWGRADENSAHPLPGFTCALRTDDSDPFKICIRTVGLLLTPTNGTKLIANGFPDREFDQTTSIRVIRGTSMRIQTR